MVPIAWAEITVRSAGLRKASRERCGGLREVPCKAVRWIMRNCRTPNAKMLAPFERTDGEFPYENSSRPQDFMQSLVGIFRTEKICKKALGELEKLKPRLERMRADGTRMFNPGWHLTRDLRSMVLISEAVTRSALARRESRGAHSRIDYPNYDDTWAKQTTSSPNQAAKMTLEQRPVDEMPAELKELLAENQVMSDAKMDYQPDRRSDSARVRGGPDGGSLWTTKCRLRRAWSCWTRYTRYKIINRRISLCAGIAKRASVAPVQLK